MTVAEQFSLKNKNIIITGGAGLLGIKHAEAIMEAGGTPILWDINVEKLEEIQINEVKPYYQKVDITDLDSIINNFSELLSKFQNVHGLINNAANDPKVKNDKSLIQNRLENFSTESFLNDINVGLTGAFLCTQVIGTYFADNKNGVILNIASDLGVIAPDQRIYQKEGVAEDEQPVKPVTYSVIKHGLVGLTKYTATYWAHQNVRANSLSPGGIYNGQPEEFVSKLTNLIPMSRMADKNEYKAAVVFLLSEASSYMTGTNLIIDGGRTCW